MDVIGIPMGCITGWLQAQFPNTWGGPNGTCADIAGYYARTWAQNNMDGSGPGLTSADLQNILTADPFSNPNYVPTLQPPNSQDPYTTVDGRFTECHTSGCLETIDFEPYITTKYSQGYSTTETFTNSYSHTETFSVDQKFQSSAFWNTFKLSLETKNEMTWVFSTSSSVSNSNGQTASFDIVGPNPGYDGPLEFVPFQDNYFGTFMFYP